MHSRGGQVRVEVDIDETGSNLKVKVTNRGKTIPEGKIAKLLCLQGKTTNWDPLMTNSLTIHQDIVRRAGGEISYKKKENLN